MSLLTSFQDIKSSGIEPAHFGEWLHAINDAFHHNFAPTLTADTVLSDIRSVWPDASKNDVIIGLESLTNTEGHRAFSGEDIRRAVSLSYGGAKKQLTVVAKMPGDTTTGGPRWQNTDFLVEPSITVTVKYISGQWTANPATGMVGANGNSSLKAKEGYALPGENEGALVGRVVNNDGPGPVFLVGDSVTVQNNVKGYLELGINDDLMGAFGAGFADNEGELLVEVSSSGVA